jgi:uncharacterized protein YacL
MEKKKINIGDKPAKKKHGLASLIFFIVGASVAIITAYQIFDNYRTELFGGLSEDNIFYICMGVYIVSSLFFGLIFYLSCPFVIKWVYKIGTKFENTLSGYTSKEITSGTIGLVFGLLIAFLLSDIIKLIPIKTFSTILIVLTYLILAFVGIRLGIKYIGEIIIVNKKEKSAELESSQMNYKILDSSVIIDGRILELVRTGFLEGPFIIPSFIIKQLKNIAENADLLKRNRGRRGLDIINALQNEETVRIILSETDYPDINDIDTKILKLAQQYRAKVITNDYNLNKLATVIKVSVLNINELANAIKPIALPGETMSVNIVKPGKEFGQGIGFLEDGTMIVVENGGDYIGKIMTVTVTTSLQTNAGRMIFTRIM